MSPRTTSEGGVGGDREMLALTGLRAVAAWVVVAFHFARDAAPWWPLRRVVASGHTAVDLFFVLSGFVLAHRYAPEDVERGGPGGGRRAFWVRRFARVVPVYLLSLGVGFAAEWPRSARDLATEAGVLRLALQLPLLNAWSHLAMFRLNWAAWSLSVEALMYALFPWILAAVARLSTRRLAALVVACWAALFVAPALYGALDPDHLGRPFALGDEVLWGWYLKFFPVQRLPEFVAGVAAAVLVRRAAVPRAAHSVVAWGAALSLVGIAVSGVVPYAFLQAGVLVPLFVVLVVALSAPGGSAVRLLSARPVVAVGRASYATYILHVPVFLLAARFHPALWRDPRAVAGYALVLAVASLAVHRWIEEPARRAIVRRWATPAVGAQSEALPAQASARAL